MAEGTQFLDGHEGGIDEDAWVSVHHDDDGFALVHVPLHSVGHGTVGLPPRAILAVVDVQIFDARVEFSNVALGDRIGCAHQNLISGPYVRLRFQSEVGD